MILNLQDKIGQLCIFGWQGETEEHSRTFCDHAQVLVHSLKVGGVIVMGRNVGTGERLRHTLRDFQLVAKATGMPPLFVCVDQEGGRVTRLKPPYWQSHPSARTLGSTGLAQNVRNEMKSIGKELKDVGINWNFAPVLDVDSNPNNPVIADRSYSSNPNETASFGSAAIDGLQIDNGIMACGKHFPGHGDTNIDSHLALPVISHSLQHLHEVELVPFVAAISNHVAGIMTTHIMFPELDNEFPATLSVGILTDLLRVQLKYAGLIVTDCLEMRALSERWGSAESAVLSILAGSDIVLCCHTLETQQNIVEALIHAVSTGRINERRIDESVNRILLVKQQWLQPLAVAG